MRRMARKIVLILTAAVTIVISFAAVSEAGWYDSSWAYRRPITITGSTAGAQTNYQVQVNVTYDSDMQADFDDIRFTSSDGITLIDHWLESKTDSTSAVFWTEVSSIPASPSTTTIYVYYGNASASSASNGTNTFDFFDDFESYADINAMASGPWTRGLTAHSPAIETDTVSGSKVLSLTSIGSGWEGWYTDVSFSSPRRVTCKIRFIGTIPGDYNDCGLQIGFATGAACGGWNPYYTDKDYFIKYNDQVLWGGGTEVISTASFETWEVTMRDQYVQLYKNGNLRLTNPSTAGTFASNAVWLIIVNNSVHIHFDDAIVRKYALPEPSVGAAGAEEGTDVGAFFLLFD